jgi:hypothetical protein
MGLPVEEHLGMVGMMECWNNGFKGIAKALWNQL